MISGRSHSGVHRNLAGIEDRGNRHRGREGQPLPGRLQKHAADVK